VPVPAPSVLEEVPNKPLISMSVVLLVARTSEFAPVPGVLAIRVTVLPVKVADTVGSLTEQLAKHCTLEPFILSARIVALPARVVVKGLRHTSPTVQFGCRILPLVCLTVNGKRRVDDRHC